MHNALKINSIMYSYNFEDVVKIRQKVPLSFLKIVFTLFIMCIIPRDINGKVSSNATQKYTCNFFFKV